MLCCHGKSSSYIPIHYTWFGLCSYGYISLKLLMLFDLAFQMKRKYLPLLPCSPSTPLHIKLFSCCNKHLGHAFHLQVFRSIFSYVIYTTRGQSVNVYTVYRYTCMYLYFVFSLAVHFCQWYSFNCLDHAGSLTFYDLWTASPWALDQVFWDWWDNVNSFFEYVLTSS